MLHDGNHIVDVVDDYLHELLSPQDAQYVDQHSQSCAICRVAMAEARQRFDLLKSVANAEPSAKLVHQTLFRVTRNAQKTRFTKRAAWRIFGGAVAAASITLALIQMHFAYLMPSPYELRIVTHPQYLSDAAGSVRAFVINKDDGKPAAGVPVKIQLLGAKGNTVELASFETDQDGTGQPIMHLPGWSDGNYQMRVIASPSGFDAVLDQPIALRHSWKMMLSSDKPVYQPGQTIHLRSLTLRQPDLHPVAGQTATFTIADPHGNIIYKHADVTSKYGITSGDCPLADEIIEGDYTIHCVLGDVQSAVTVEVKKYVLPRFKLELNLDKSYYSPGDRMNLTIKTGYFFGKPVAAGTVEVTERGVAVSQPTVGKTDDSGNLQLQLNVPRAPYVPDAPDTKLALDVVIHDSAGQEQRGNIERVITTTPLHIEVIPESGELVPGIANRVYVLTTYADGAPAKARVAISGLDHELKTGEMGAASFDLQPTAQQTSLTVRATDDSGLTVTRQVPIQVGQNTNKFILRTDKAVYTGGDTMTLTILGSGDEPVFVDLVKDGQIMLSQSVSVANGNGQKQFTLPADLAGTLRVNANRLTATGISETQSRMIYVKPARQVHIDLANNKPEYRPGESATVNVSLTDANGKSTPGAISLAAVDEAVFSVLEQKPGSEGTFFTLEKELLKPIYSLCDWSPDSSGNSSDQKVQWEQALFSRASVPANETIVGLGNRLPNEVMESASQDKESVARRQEQALVEVENAWFVLACVFAGVVVFWTFTVTGMRRAWALGFVILIFGTVLITLMPVARDNQRMVLQLDMQRRAPMLQYKTEYAGDAPNAANDSVLLPQDDGALPMGGIIISGYDDFRHAIHFEATDAKNHNKDGENVLFGNGSIEFGSKIPAPRLREWFPETLLWRPELITDDSGHAKINFDLADSITDWRLTASAVTADGRLGGAQSSLRVFQPFFVDLNLPVALTRGDEIAVPVVVYNYSGKSETVDLKLEPGDGWFDVLDGLDQHIDLKPGEVKSSSYRIRATKVGIHQFQVTARGGAIADAIKKDIEVLPGGRRIDQVVNGVLRAPETLDLNIPPDAIDSSAKAFVKIYPSSFSQLVEGIDGIFQMPSGCFEQTSSTTYPNVLALQYLKRIGKADPQVEAKAREYIHLGYQRLVSFEVPGGGFDWFGQPASTITLTAYGLMEFQDMAAVSDVDPQLIARTRNWLLSRRQMDGSWQAEPLRFHDGLSDFTSQSDPALATTAYAAWAVFGGHPDTPTDPQAQLTLDYLQRHDPQSISDPYVLAVLANAELGMYPNGHVHAAAMNRLQQLMKTSSDAKLTWWTQSDNARTTFYGSGQSSAVETTALATLALIQANRNDPAIATSLAWLISQKDSRGTWYSTQATVLALKALVAGTAAPSGTDVARTLKLTLGDKSQTIAITPEQSEVMRQIDLSPLLKPGVNHLTLEDQTNTSSGYQIDYRYNLPATPVVDAAQPLSIQLDLDRDDVRVGQIITATATISNNTPSALPMVMVDLPIPAGFSIDREDMEHLLATGAIGKYQITPRSAILYLRGLEANKPLKFTYRLTATMPAKITVPAAKVYEYYDPDKQAVSAEKQLRVGA